MPPEFGKEKTMEYVRLCMGAQLARAPLFCAPTAPRQPATLLKYRTSPTLKAGPAFTHHRSKT